MPRSLAAPVVEPRPRRIAAPRPAGPGLDPAEETAEREAEQTAAGGRRPPSTATPRLREPSRLAGGGRPLDPPLRHAMEQRLGADLSAVRVHTGPGAARSADSLAARAFSVGPDIGFAAGEYDPASTAGRRLIAHELAHTLQPEDGRRPTVRRQPRPGGGGGVPGVDPGAVAPVELLGTPRFAPSAALAERIRSVHGDDVRVPVKVGGFAAGEIPVRWAPPSPMSLDPGFQTPAPRGAFPAWGIPLTHPAFPAHPLAEPTLWIRIVDGVVDGAMGWVTPLGLATHPDRFRQSVPLGALFRGLGDFTEVRLTGEIVNSLFHGRFRYSAEGVTFSAGDFHGTGSIDVRDGAYHLDARLPLPVDGLRSAEVPVTADERSEPIVFATRTWTYSRDLGGRGRLSGELTGTLGRGLLTVRGTARYARTDPRVTGTVVVLVTRQDLAQEAVRDRLGPDAPPPTPATAGGLAVTGFGELEFALSDWLTGRADVVVHPEGHLTARGELTPTAVVVLSRMVEKRKELAAPLSGKETYPIDGLPPLADVSAVLEWRTSVSGSLGPATLHDIRIGGLLSTHPAIVNRFDLSGVVSAPATAGVHLWVRAGLAGRLATKELASATLVGTGDVELQMYAEAAAQAGRRPRAGTPKPEYFLKGHVEATAALLLRLGLSLQGSALFWDGTVRLVDREWPLGTAGARLAFEYVLGTGKTPGTLDTSFTSLSFDSAKFAEAIVRRNLAKAPGKAAPTPADAAAGSDVTNPAAPPAPALPSGTLPPTGGTDGRVEVRLEEPFTMVGEPHLLTLTMIEPPDLSMASPRPASLLTKVKRARAALRRNPPPAAQLQARLADLGLIERQAMLVLAEADRIAQGAAYLTPRIPGFRDLRTMIQDYGSRYDETDLETALGRVAVDPADPATVLVRFPSLAADPLLVNRVGRILRGGVDAVDLRRIVDHHRPSEEALLVDLLEYVETMQVHAVPRWERVVSDLAVGGNKLKGARFVLTYVARHGTWSDLAFESHDEDDAEPGSRRWDAWMSGRLYEFKAWYSWRPVADLTFARQILEDYRKTRVGDRMPLRWVFGPGPMTRAEILDHMALALDRIRGDLRAGRESKPPGYTPTIVDFIEARLPGIVLKVT